MNVVITLLLIKLILFIKVDGELSLSAIPINPVTADVEIKVVNSTLVPECSFQCRDNEGNLTECLCYNRACNKKCESDRVIGLIPGTLNTIYVYQRVSTDDWEMYSVSINLPSVNYKFNMIKLKRTEAYFEVVPTTTSIYISDSCSLTIADSTTQIFRNVSCEGRCDPCTRFNITLLTPGTKYALRVLPNFAKGPIFADFRTYAFTYLLKPLYIDDDSANMQVFRGDAPEYDTCNFLIKGKSEGINNWEPPKCENVDSCPNDCSNFVDLVKLKPRETYILAMNSTGTAEEVWIEFTTGSIEYRGIITDKGSTWVLISMYAIDGSEINNEICKFFITSYEFGRLFATCNDDTCPDDCKSANITNLLPGIYYTLGVVPKNKGSRFFVGVRTYDITFSINSSNIYPTKINLNLNSNYEPRGSCSYRIKDSTANYLPIVCEPTECSNDCRWVNVTGLQANQHYTLEVHNTYDTVELSHSFITKKVNYVIEQYRANVSEVSFTVIPDADYTEDDTEKCSFIIQKSTGERIPIGKCITPPCEYVCSNVNFTLSEIDSGQQYLIYMNSSFSNLEYYSSLYTVQSEIFLEQKETTVNSIKVDASLNETSSIIKCEIQLYDTKNNQISPNCSGGCPTNCDSFTLQNLLKSQSYKVVLISNLKNTNTELTAYTLFESPRILSYNITSKTSIRLKWEYDFITNKDFIFAVVATNNSNGALLFNHSYFPPSVTADLISLPPETDMTVKVCTAPINSQNLTNCDTIPARITIDNPDPLGPLTILSITEKKVDILLPSITPYQGNIKQCYIYTIYMIKESYYNTLTLPPQNKIIFGGYFFGYNGVSGILHAKFTAEECRKTQSFQVGDGKVYNGIKNRPIIGDNLVSVLFRSCINETICSDSPIPSPISVHGSNKLVHILVAISVILIVIFVSIVLYVHHPKISGIKINFKNDFLKNTSGMSNENNQTNFETTI